MKKPSMFLVFPLLGGIAMTGQAMTKTIRIADIKPECENCLEISRMVSIGNVRDSVSLGGLPRVISSPTNHFAISEVLHPQEILLYDLDGNLIAPIGRTGQGPGEVSAVWYLGFGRGDSILVGERGGRIHLFSGDGAWGRTLNIEAPGRRAVQFPGGEFLVAAEIPSRTRAGLPVHRFSTDGNDHISFGGEDRIVPSQPLAGMRIIGLGSDSTAWISRPDLYRVEEWSMTGKLLRTVYRDVDWFPDIGDKAYTADAVKERPDPTISGIHFDEPFLWITINVAAQNWRPAEVGPKGRPLDSFISLINRQWDTRIEVIDLSTGILVGALWVDEFMRGFSGPQEVFSLREDELGMVYIDVWSLQLADRISNQLGGIQ